LIQEVLSRASHVDHCHETGKVRGVYAEIVIRLLECLKKIVLKEFKKAYNYLQNINK
jgi:hypothetical protein